MCVDDTVRCYANVNACLSERLVKQEERTHSARHQRDAARAEVSRLQRELEAAKRDMKRMADDMDCDTAGFPCCLCAKNNAKCDPSDTCFEWRGQVEMDFEDGEE